MIFGKQIQEITAKAWPIWLVLLAKLGISTTKNALEKRLPDGSPEEIFTVNTGDLMLNIVKVMSDDNPDNAGQTREEILKYLNVFLVPFLFGLFQPVVDGIKRAYNQAMVQFVKDYLNQIGLFLTDEITPNKEQISEYSETTLHDPKTKTLVIDTFVGGNLDTAGLDEDLVAFLKEALGIGWDALIGVDSSALSAISVSYTGEVKTVSLAMKNGKTATLIIQ